MKAQYKIGMLIDYVSDGEGNRATDVITGVIHRETECTYLVRGSESTEIEESDIVASYRQVLPRATRAAKKVKKEVATPGKKRGRPKKITSDEIAAANQ